MWIFLLFNQSYDKFIISLILIFIYLIFQIKQTFLSLIFKIIVLYNNPNKFKINLLI